MAFAPPGTRSGDQYWPSQGQRVRTDVGHGRLQCRMLNIPRTKNEEPIHVPLKDAAVAALRVVHDRGDGRGHTFASRLRMKGAPFEDIADLLGSLTMTIRYAHLGPNKLHAVVSLLEASDTTSDTSQPGVPATTSQVAAH